MGAGRSGLFHGTSGGMQNMPNSHIAKTPIEKFTRYSLDYSNPNARGKAEAYERGLGFRQENALVLRDSIHRQISSGLAKPYQVQSAEYGVKYKFRLSITGPNGKTKNVIVVYQIDKGSTIPRMITNYLEEKK